MDARFLVLGVLHRGDFHPYEIKRRLQSAMVECYSDVDVGTLYYAVRKLEKAGLIEAVAHERVARGGMRTIYRITATGRAQFRTMLHGQFDQDGPVPETLYGAMLFLHLADQAVVEDALRNRIARLDESIEKLGPIAAGLAPVLSTGGAHLLQHIERQRRMDRAWLEELLKNIRNQGIRDVRDPAMLGKSYALTRRPFTRSW